MGKSQSDGDPSPNVEPFELAIGYRFKSKPLLLRALTHSSRKTELDYSNERLEFLGDAVLGLIVSERLFADFPHLAEGELTRVKSAVVSRSTLSKVARKLSFGKYLIIGKGLAHRRTVPASLLANGFEAVLAAIYLDGGMDPAREFVFRSLTEQIDRVLNNRHDFNYKSILQQFTQKELGVTPTYRVKSEQGPDHFKSFVVVAQLQDTEYGTGHGRTKKEAEQVAAAATLRSFGVDPATGKSIATEADA